MPVLAIDQGTSATKAVVVDGERILATAEAPVTVDASADGAVELDPEALWSSVVAAGRRALDEAGSPAIDAIGTCTES